MEDHASLISTSMAVLALAVLYSALGLQAQTKPAGPARAVILVDTDDTCRLTVDDADQGVITPAKSVRVTVKPGGHVLKCVVEEIPDLVWRKIVTAKSSEQSAALVALKALHIQYDEAVRTAQQQKDQAAAAKAQAAADEEAIKAQAAAAVEKRSRDLADTMSFIQQKLNGEDSSSDSATVGTGCHFTDLLHMNEGQADPQNCTVSYKFIDYLGGNCGDPTTDTDQYSIDLRSVQDVQVKRWQESDNEIAYSGPMPIDVVITGSSIAVKSQRTEKRKGKTVVTRDDPETKVPRAEILYADGSTAERVAKAIKYASALCGAKSASF